MQATHRTRRAYLAALALAGAALAASPAHAQTATFNFDADAVGTTTAFTDTSSGVSATFTSPGNPAGFIVVGAPPGFFTLLSGNVLTDPGPFKTNNIPLDVLFSAPLKTLSLNFATAGNGSLTANFFTGGLGGTLVGSSTTPSAVPLGGFVPEGALSFSTPSSFDTVVLTSTAPDFAVDNIVVGPAPVPEASTTASFGLLLVLGLGGVVVAGRRKKTQPAS